MLNGEIGKQHRVTDLRREDLKETGSQEYDVTSLADYFSDDGSFFDSDNETGFASVINNVFLPKNGDLACNFELFKLTTEKTVAMRSPSFETLIEFYSSSSTSCLHFFGQQMILEKHLCHILLFI